MRKSFRYFGIASMIIGILTIFDSLRVQGFVVADALFTEGRAVFGILLFLIGLVVGVASAEREVKTGKLELHVRDLSRGRNKDHDRVYVMISPGGDLGQGPVTLGAVKAQVGKLLKDPDGREYMEIVRETYGPPLQELASSSDSETATVAREFLEAIGSYAEETIGEKPYRLSKDEREEIKHAFRGFDGTFDKHQQQVLDRYNISIERRGSGHYHLRKKGGGTITTSSTPSDHRTGRNMVTQIIHLIEEDQ